MLTVPESFVTTRASFQSAQPMLERWLDIDCSLGSSALALRPGRAMMTSGHVPCSTCSPPSLLTFCRAAVEAASHSVSAQEQLPWAQTLHRSVGWACAWVPSLGPCGCCRSSCVEKPSPYGRNTGPGISSGALCCPCVMRSMRRATRSRAR